jgi:DNA polymerase III sliding clamp (beta) subunit (PCNA family)
MKMSKTKKRKIEVVADCGVVDMEKEVIKILLKSVHKGSWYTDKSYPLTGISISRTNDVLRIASTDTFRATIIEYNPNEGEDFSVTMKVEEFKRRIEKVSGKYKMDKVNLNDILEGDLWTIEGKYPDILKVIPENVNQEVVKFTVGGVITNEVCLNLDYMKDISKYMEEKKISGMAKRNDIDNAPAVLFQTELDDVTKFTHILCGINTNW